MDIADSQPLLTADDVRRWVAERDSLATEYGVLLNRLRAVQQKLDVLAEILPENVVAALIGDPAQPLPSLEPTTRGRGAENREVPSTRRGGARVPITDAVEGILASEHGGRSPAWLRGQLLENPEFAPRVEKTPTSVSNALLRLVDRGKVVREEGLYYHPAIYAQIRSGELVEERLENAPSLNFNAVMHKVMRKTGGRFTAADAMAAAKEDPFLREKIEGQPSRVYSWLSRELFKKKLLRAGEEYFYPPEEDEAPNGNAASASSAGRAATLPFENRDA